MKTTDLIRTTALVLVSIILLAEFLAAGNIRNGGTINNSNTMTTNGYVENYKNAAGGIFNNTAGTYSVTSYFSNYNSGGTSGQASISGGTLDVTGNYTNSSGSTSVTGTGALKLSGATTANASGTFTVSSGSVEYAGSAQNVLAVTYGGLKLSGSGNKTLDAGTTTANTTFDLSAGTLVVGSNTLDIKTSTLTSTAGTLSAASGTVSYTAAGTQQVYPATYGTLTLSGAFSKTAQGNVTINTTLNNPSGTTFDISANNFSTGASANVADAVNAGTISVSGVVTFGQASPDIGGTFSYTGSSQTVAIAQYKNLSLGGTTPQFGAGEFKVSGNLMATSTPGFNAASIIHYNGGGAQGVASLAYKLLKFSEAGIKSISGAATAAAAAAGSVAVEVASTNSPALTIATGGSLGITLGQLKNSSTVNIDGTGTVTLSNGNLLNFVSGANININGASSQLTVTGDVENDGTITNAGTLTVN